MRIAIYFQGIIAMLVLYCKSLIVQMDPLQRLNAPKKHPLAMPTKTDKAESKIAKQPIVPSPVKQVKQETIIHKPQSDAKPQQVKVQPKQQIIIKPEPLPQKKEPIPIQEAKMQINTQQKEVKMDKPITQKTPQPLTAIKSEQKKQVIISESVLSEPLPKAKAQSAIKTQKTPQIGQKVAQKEVQRHPVRIEINQSSQKGSGLLKSTYYHIIGQDQHGSINIFRRYEQFQALSDILRERWPGCFLPALSKETQAKKQGEKDKHKRATLAAFLLGLSYSSHVYYREEVQLFLRSPDVQASEMFRQMPPLKTRDVISRLRSSFGELLDQPVTPAHTTRINSFVAALRKIIGNLGSLSMRALALSEAYQRYSQSLGKFSRVHKSYEQLCLTQYSEIGGQRPVVIPDSEHKLQRLQELTKHNPFLKLHTFLSNQVRDAEAFIQIIIASELFVLRKEDLQRETKELQGEIQGIMLGHKSLKTMASRRPKEQLQGELQAKQRKMTEQRDTMVEMFAILQILLATRSINHFQTFKRDKYREILEEWARVTQQSSPQLEAVWQFIAEGSRTHLKA